MKAPVGLLSDRTVLRSKMEGLCPDKFQFSVLVPGRVWGSARPNKNTSETRRSLRSEVPDGPCSTRGQEPSTSIGGFFVLLALCGMVWYTQLNKSNSGE